jgi:hypothetical protein
MRAPRLLALMDGPAVQPKACNLKLYLRRVAGRASPP